MTPQASWNLFADLSAMWSYPYCRNALIAGSFVAIMAGAMGWLMVLRKQSFLGHTLSLVAYPGAAAATALGIPILFGYYGAVLIAAAVAVSSSSRGLGGERRAAATTGTIQAVALAAGVLLSSLSPSFLESTTTLLFGSFLGVTSTEVLATAIVAVVVLSVLGVCARPLVLTTFDPLAGEAAGLPVRIFDAVEVLLLGVVVAAVSQITGALLVFALLVMPAAAAVQLTTKVWRSVGLSIALGLVVVWAGISIAFYLPHLPLGFTITTTGMALYLVSSGWRSWSEGSHRLRSTS